uniref:C-type lectin domain-containing protein n=1 Tax=Cyprinus carpio TaxID=7962 RepID=A0A8C1VWC3_CYPCA
RAAVVCLVLLCVLLLTAVLALCVTLTQEKQQFISNNENLTNERKQLILKNTNLTNEREQSYRQMSVNGDNKLTAELVLLTAGWTYYQYSFYYMSKEQKNWTESRKYCRERGADLIIINNREEQDFVHNTSGNATFYIGLTDIDVEGTWKWVDNSTLNPSFSFWASHGGTTEPNAGQGTVDEDCVVTVAVPPPKWANLVGWLDVACNVQFQWICEKRSQFILP